MALISISDCTVRFDDPPLLDRISLTVERGERVCLVGRNGTGKSTLLRIIAGRVAPDGGEVARERGAIIADLPQEVPQDLRGPIFDVVADGVAEQGKLLAEYHRLSERLSGDADGSRLKRLEEVQHELEMGGAWKMHSEVERVISQMRLDPNALCETLSAGMKRRVLLARALVSRPDLLLLDEPTNHLDVDTIGWLEEYLLSAPMTLLFVTHDRMFLRKLATRIVSLDRGALKSFACDYDTYLVRQEALWEEEAKQRDQFRKRLAEEEAWLRRGVRARRARNEGRVKALHRMREFKRSLRQRMGSIHLEAQEAQRSGKLVIEMEGASSGYGDLPIVQDFSTTVLRGDKVGIMGPNGCGKTTLLRMFLGHQPLWAGTVRHGVNLQVAYFDQLREQLREEKTVQENVADGAPFITINGRSRHIIAYLQDFLFSPARARSPVSILSGGERNRLLLAKLFTLPSNVLVLDEPTNDLDAETLDLLEALLVGYGGTVLFVSHDRDFINNVATSTIVFEGPGRVQEYIGGYDDWLRQRKPSAPAPTKRATAVSKRERRASDGPRKLTFGEKRELEALPERIASLEDEQRELTASMVRPEVYTRGDDVAAIQLRLDAVLQELEAAYDRWAELEERRES